MTVTPALKRALEARDGKVCAWHGHGCPSSELTVQHRANKGMGGYKAADVIENLLWLCGVVNQLIGADAKALHEAVRRGVKVSRYEDPAEVPVWFLDSWWVLTPEGLRHRISIPSGTDWTFHE